MQGTGSHDTRVQDKFYSLEWICARGAVGLVDEPLYRYPALSYQAEVHAAVNIGLARAALDTVTEMSGGAKIMPGAAKLADRAYYRSELARAEAKWRSARAFFYDASEHAWDVLLAGNPIKLELENLLRLSATHAAHSSAEVVQQVYRIAGMAAIHKSHRLQHIVRDTMVVAATRPTALLAQDAPFKIGVGSDPVFSSFYLAAHEKMFEAEKLNVAVQLYADGGEAMNALVAQQVSLAAAVEPTNMVRFARAELRPLAVVYQSGRYVKMVVGKDVESLEKIKKFGIVAGSISEYCTLLALKKIG